MSGFFNPQLKRLEKMTNVIASNKCYVSADPRGMIFRFVVNDEIAPPILVDEQLAGQLHGMIGEFLDYHKQQREKQDESTLQQPKA
jgi:hypothetical protein